MEKNALTEEIEGLVKKYGATRSSLLPILQELQKKTSTYLKFRATRSSSLA
jgi:NADH:ubiquinone oxidoreductase subunit E